MTTPKVTWGQKFMQKKRIFLGILRPK